MSEEQSELSKRIGVIGQSHLGVAAALADQGYEVFEDIDPLDERLGIGDNIIYLSTPEEQAKARRRELVEKYGEPEKTLEDEVLEALMPESGELNDFVFGPPKRQADETQEWYKARLKVEKKMLAVRGKRGVSAWNTTGKGQLINDQKQKLKRYRELKAKTRVRISRAKRKEMGLL